jgi:predicted nuclease of predicted toxin-antitoxin system
MKFLWDHNLSPRLVKRLADVFPDGLHVGDVGLAAASDDAVWRFAAEHGRTIVSKDSDFLQRSLVLGPPPKVVWVRCGNCSTDALESLLRRHREDLRKFLTDETSAFLVLGPG